ncbi:MAG TPA: glutathione S-transferase family protein [Devosiaceae bacterium]
MVSGLKLWGRLTSANVQKAVWALEEVGAQYERVDAGGKFGGLDRPDYLALNPNGLVPTLQDGDLTIWESHAIVRYVAARFGAGSLWPTDIAARAVTDQWAEWTNTTFQPAWIGLFTRLVRTPPAKRNPEAIQAAFNASLRAFGMLEDRLGQTHFLGGDELTYADIVAGVSLYRWFSMDIPRPQMPNVEAWHKRLLERPAFVRGACIPFDDLVAR